jgi:hypothetical protein
MATRRARVKFVYYGSPEHYQYAAHGWQQTSAILPDGRVKLETMSAPRRLSRSRKNIRARAMRAARRHGY